MREVVQQPRLPDKSFGTILYVEDDDVNWRVICRTLSDRYNLVRAHTAEHAIELMKTVHVDTALLDIQLRGSSLDGLELADVMRGKRDVADLEFDIREKMQRIPIIFVTAYAERYRSKELLERGGDEVIYKPIDLLRLNLALARLTVSQLAV